MRRRLACLSVVVAALLLFGSVAEALTAEEFTKLPRTYKMLYTSGFIDGVMSSDSLKCTKSLTTEQIVAYADRDVADMRARGVIKPGNRAPAGFLLYTVLMMEAECMPAPSSRSEK